MAFSMSRNFKEMTKLETGTERTSLPSINGIRALMTFLMVLSHKLMQFFYYTISNQKRTYEIFESTLSLPFRALFFSTEAFLFMGGFLTAYTIVGKLNRKQNVNVLKEIFMRYLRFMPTMAAMIFFHAYILPLLVYGPNSPIIIKQPSEICKKFYWRNLLMIHNWFGFENTCMFNLHHIGTDFVLFIVALLIIVNLHKYPNVLIFTVAVIGFSSTIATFLIVYNEELILYIYYGAS